MRTAIYAAIYAAIILTSAASACQACNGCGCVMGRIPMPQQPQQPQPHFQPQCRPKPTKEQLMMARAEAARAREEDERICDAILVARFNKWQEKQQIDPYRDEYRRYLADKQRRAEVFDDPDQPQMQEFYRHWDEKEGRTRNDYKKWLESRNCQPTPPPNDFAEWLKSNPQAPSVPKLDEEKFTESLRRALNNAQAPTPKPKKKTSDDE